MVGRKGVLVSLIAFLLGALAVAFSFIAYAKRIKAGGAKVNGSCVYPSSPSTALGTMAALFLLAEQILISAATYCFCCCGVRCVARCTIITSLIFFICSWITFVIAFFGLIYTATLNNTSYLTKFNPRNKDDDNCDVGRENLFLGAAFWCIISIVLGLMSYAFWVCGGGANATRNNNNSLGVANLEQGIAMGEPRSELPKEQSR